MIMNESEQLQDLNSVGRRNKILQPFIELAKLITDSPICEIEIIDSDYLYTLAHSVEDIKVALVNYSIIHETLQKNGVHEIEDLSKENRYKNHAYAKEIPPFRYYLGIKLTTSDGKDIGTISVLDPIPKRISKEQKVQFKLLSHAVMHSIESEFGYNSSYGELNKLKATLHKLNHDVRSPINGIILMAELLIDDIDEDNDEEQVQVEEFKMVKESAETIIDIIDRVLETSGVNEFNERLLVKESLSSIPEKIEALYYPLTLDKKLSLFFTYQLDREILITSDSSIKLLRIIGNLVSNAIKFSPENGSIAVVFSEIRKKNRTLLNITVKDTGKSMSSGQITSFNSGKPVARTIVNGDEHSHGTGLQHVHQMIFEEGGTVTIESGENSGTLFSISLPLPADTRKTEKKSVPVSVTAKRFEKPSLNGMQ
ncbi:MAG: sensor histidine kinase [Balneolaceae bacterium]|nr:MAG: sensor histidine kinase [Balneolaceae bacterium]